MLNSPRSPLVLAALVVAAVGLALPFTVSGQIELRVIADPPGPDDANLNGEVVTVTNRRTVPLELSGWRLCDAVEDCFEFPEGTMVGPSANVRVHSGAGRDTPVDLYMGRVRPLWNDWADIATLRDGEGAIRARCVWDRGRGLDCANTGATPAKRTRSGPHPRVIGEPIRSSAGDAVGTWDESRTRKRLRPGQVVRAASKNRVRLTERD